MTAKIGVVAVVLVLAAVALWHPAPRFAAQTPIAASFASPDDGAARRDARPHESRRDAPASVVYVAGAVRRPGLYRIAAGDRAADAVAKAGGLGAGADAGAVNLAEHVADGDEVYVPVAGETAHASSSRHSTHRHRRTRRGRSGASDVSLPAAGVELNAAGETELAAVPGIGAAIAARIVEMRTVDGAFTSLDELLDVAGMTQTRLERARPYLHLP